MDDLEVLRLIELKKLIIFDMHGTLIYQAGGVSRLVDGAKELIRFLKEGNKLIALASNSPGVLVKALLEEAAMLQSFDLIISVDQVINPKPHPEIYLKVMRYFQLAADETLVFEDTQIGVNSAKSAGIETISIGRRIDGADFAILNYTGLTS